MFNQPSSNTVRIIYFPRAESIKLNGDLRLVVKSFNTNRKKMSKTARLFI